MSFGVYAHWPFCKAKCPYCDFTRTFATAGVDAMSFARALAREIAWMRQLAGPRTVTSVFFGGGTPSLMPPQAVEHVLDAIAGAWDVAADAEVTLEANPTSVEAENFRGYRAAGVNRVSVGVQALDDADLAALGRQHSVDEALAAYRLAASIFPRTSFEPDLRAPEPDARRLAGGTRRALASSKGTCRLPAHHRGGHAFADRHARGTLVVPDEETGADLYEITQELNGAAGLAAYEVSNHAAPGHECRHNLLYWRYGDYAGIGPGAHARLTTAAGRRAFVTEKHPETWRTAVERQGHALIEDAILDPREATAEKLLMGLRLDEGVALDAAMRTLIDEQRLAALTTEGLVEQSANRLRATDEGRRVLDAVLRDLVQ